MTERTHNFTGKSDFFDWCNMHYTPETIIEKATIFLGDAEIRKDKPEDLIPYYTHIIASAGCGPDKQNIFLSKQSWINLEEAEHIAIIIYDMIKAARKAKKEKVKFDFNYYKKQKSYYEYSDKSSIALYKAAADIISKDTDIIKEHLSADYNEALQYIETYMIPRKFYSLHDSMHNRMREDFVRYAAENGYAALTCDEFQLEKIGERHHPIIWHMSIKISDYYKMLDRYGR